MHKSSRILISGAGVAGLTSAIWLGRAGFRPVVVERAPDVRADGYIISLSSHSYQYARKLGLLDEAVALGAGIRESAYLNHAGRPMLELDYRALFSGLDIVQLMRDDLQRVLFDAARQVAEFRFGDSITGVRMSEEKAEVSFRHAPDEAFDLLLGADGLHSNTRQLVWPADQVNAHYLGLFSAAFKLPNVLGLKDRFENHMEQNRYMCVYTTRAGDLACVFIWKRENREAPDPVDRAAVLRADFAGAAPTTTKVLEHCPPDGFYMDNLIQIHLPAWGHQRAVLLGDAAHCMTLLSGQGASAAFWGASAFCEALIDGTPESALATYEKALRPAINAKQPATLKAADWYIPGSRPRYWMRDTAMTCLPNWLFQSYFQRKYSSA
ncbi:MAG: FAD-dependent monooxygenase [Pseudomonadota bacterium]